MTLKKNIRIQNYIRVIESLWLYPNSSRADIARNLNLDRSTVGSLIDKMIERDIVEQKSDELNMPRNGRPPILLHLKPRYAYSIGVDLTYPNIRLNAVDLCGDLIGELSIPIKTFGSKIIDSLAVELARFKREFDEDFVHGPGLVSVGIGVSGGVDEINKKIIISDALHIEKSTAIIEPLTTVLNVPITLLNDAQACVLQEAGMRNRKNLLLVQIESHSIDSQGEIGIGVGIVVNNQLIQGRPTTHLLKRVSLKYKEDNNQIIDELGHSLALVANITNIGEVVLSGDVDEILKPLHKSITGYATRAGSEEESPITISRAEKGINAVASGAAYSSMKFLLSTSQFPFQLK